MHEPIGGFLELEIDSRAENRYHQGALGFNSGRSAFRYSLYRNNVRKIRLPFYLCDVLLEPIDQLGIEYEFYHVNESLEPKEQLDDHDEIIWTLIINYFGVKDQFIKGLDDPSFIIDNSQAFYARREGNLETFYSPRKFFGVPDGGFLYTKADRTAFDALSVDTSYERSIHLIKRMDIGPQRSYNDYLENRRSFTGQDMKRMSDFTSRMLSSIDYERVKRTRKKNFKELDKRLTMKNGLKIAFDLSEIECPMVYPFRYDPRLRDYLIENKVYIPKYWPGLDKIPGIGEEEIILSEEIIPLPIDQRYNSDHMERIVSLILDF